MDNVDFWPCWPIRSRKNLLNKFFRVCSGRSLVVLVRHIHQNEHLNRNPIGTEVKTVPFYGFYRCWIFICLSLGCFLIVRKHRSEKTKIWKINICRFLFHIYPQQKYRENGQINTELTTFNTNTSLIQKTYKLLLFKPN